MSDTRKGVGLFSFSADALLVLEGRLVAFDLFQTFLCQYLQMEGSQKHSAELKKATGTPKAASIIKLEWAFCAFSHKALESPFAE